MENKNNVQHTTVISISMIYGQQIFQHMAIY